MSHPACLKTHLKGGVDLDLKNSFVKQQLGHLKRRIEDCKVFPNEALIES